MRIDRIPRDANGKIVKRELPIPDRDDGRKQKQESRGGNRD
jgi:hypothetical protein